MPTCIGINKGGWRDESALTETFLKLLIKMLSIHSLVSLATVAYMASACSNVIRNPGARLSTTGWSGTGHTIGWHRDPWFALDDDSDMLYQDHQVPCGAEQVTFSTEYASSMDGANTGWPYLHAYIMDDCTGKILHHVDSNDFGMTGPSNTKWRSTTTLVKIPNNIRLKVRLFMKRSLINHEHDVGNVCFFDDLSMVFEPCEGHGKCECSDDVPNDGDDDDDAGRCPEVITHDTTYELVRCVDSNIASCGGDPLGNGAATVSSAGDITIYLDGTHADNLYEVYYLPSGSTLASDCVDTGVCTKLGNVHTDSTGATNQQVRFIETVDDLSSGALGNLWRDAAVSSSASGSILLYSRGPMGSEGAWNTHTNADGDEVFNNPEVNLLQVQYVTCNAS